MDTCSSCSHVLLPDYDQSLPQFLPGKEGAGIREDSIESWHMITHDQVQLLFFVFRRASVHSGSAAARKDNCGCSLCGYRGQCTS